MKPCKKTRCGSLGHCVGAPWLAALLLLGGARAFSQIPENALPVRIGVDQSGGNRFAGDLAAVRFYGRALTTNDVAQRFGAGREASPLAVDLGWHAGDPYTLTNPVPTGTGAISIEAWIQPASGTSGRIVDKITPGGADGFLLDTYPGNAIRLIVGAEQTSVPVAFTGQWIHVVAVIGEAGGLAVCVNGAWHGGGAAGDGLTYAGRAAPPEAPLTAWYTRPATRWTEASVIGNGRLGGMVWGGVAEERIDLNEDTLWAGEPYDNVNPNGLAALPEIRRLLVEGKNGEAQRLVEQKMNGKFNEPYLPLGWIRIAFPIRGTIEGYGRELDLARAVARTTFMQDGVRFTREVFASFPAQAIFVRVSADKLGRVSFRATLDSLIRHETRATDNVVRLTGRAPRHVDAYGSGAVIYDEGPQPRGMSFEARLVAQHEGGTLAADGDGLVAEGCDAVTLALVAATSYNGPQRSPSREGRDPAALCDGYAQALAGKRFAELRAAHVADFQALFNRVDLDFGHTAAEELPTPVRLKRFTPESDPSLAALYYQFGRYLLISCSRPGAQPSNLQGNWSHKMCPDWAANWTLNCNAEINYWPVEAANLSECHLPLIALTRELSVDGAHVAEKLYGAKGWMAHHNTDIWRQAAPVAGSATWSIFQVGGAWLCQHAWEHYAFTQDKQYLREVWPLLREAARFFLSGGLMEEPAHHWLVTGPDTNFENSFRKPDGSSAAACMGPTASMQMVRQLFANCIAAATVLGVDAEFRAEVLKALPRLAPMHVSPTDGMLQEWPEDWKRTAACQVLSSWGLICCDQVNPRRTPELAAALRKIWDTENHWAQGSVGSWQGAFPAMVYARLGAGDNVATILASQLRRVVNPNLSASFGGAEWEIDGNLGLTAALGEMLLQSQETAESDKWKVSSGGDETNRLAGQGTGDKPDTSGELSPPAPTLDTRPLILPSETYVIDLLPALPKAWPNGSVKGLKARGNFTVDLAWKDGKVETYRIASAEPRTVRVRVNGALKVVTSEKW